MTDMTGRTPEMIAPLPRITIQAFCETSDVAQTVQSASADRRMDKTHVKIQMGGVPAAVEAYRNAPTPNVVVLENTSGAEALIDGLEKLAEMCDPGTKVVIVGHHNDVLLYRELMRRGVSEYVIAPIGAIDFVRALSELFRSPGAAPVGRTMAFVGAKGGVGASVISHNVAFAIAKHIGLSTTIVDMDLPFGTAALDFNQDPAQGVADIVLAPDRADANMVDRLLAKCTENLSLLAAPATIERPYDLAEEAFDNIIDILRANVPAIVLDVPHIWTGWARRMVCGADEVVIVAAPDLANLRNAKNLIDLVKSQRPNDTPARLVLNMVGVAKRPEIKPADFARALELEPVAVIPFDPAAFGTAANNGQMLEEAGAAPKISETMLEIAQLLTRRSEVKRARKSLLEPLLAKLQLKRA